MPRKATPPTGSQRVTMKSIAIEAGVSVMTVSLALRGHPRISEATKARISTIAKRLHYTPDPALSALIAYRNNVTVPAYAGTIVYLNCHTSPQAHKEARLLNDYYTAALARAESLGYKLDVFWMGDPKLSEARSRQILHSRNIQGILIAPVPNNRPFIEEAWNEFNVVTLGYSLLRPAFDRVGASQYRSAMEAMNQVIKLGYKRIGFVNVWATEDRTQCRWSGAYLSFQFRHIPKEDWLSPLIVDSLDEKKLARWLKREKPDVIITGTGRTVELLQEMKVNIPEQIGVVFLYDPERFPHFTCIREDVMRTSEVAIEYLIRKQNNPDMPHNSPLNLMVDGIWTERESTRRISVS